ncbi:PIG-L family deacetylase [Streptomyces iconiensis]|uniref:PIG-L family deacetylase n=1 Tax=Streptomyces iconiensis TaxID=1384038 RepID=A0ABT7A0U8_9ACTN|nr:PIG-L family deacetylase [Streptomyces iconiensis]MDJ1134697.1 PIG-L family deacetylase [Streptomyces iconiensis]
MLTAALLCAVTVAGVTSCGGEGAASDVGKKGGQRAPALGPPAPTGAWASASGRTVHTSESVLQIVAHPDDDLYFINPEVGQALRSGRPLTTVFLTSGESDGVNAPRKHRPAHSPGDRATYAEARQNGIRAAYAEMVTGDRGTRWKRTVLRTAGGGRAELDTLSGHPHIRLVWTLLREAGSITAHRPHSLHGLWSGQVSTLDTQLTSSGPVPRASTYTREQLVRTLTGYLRTFRPTHIRIQDPTPGRLDRNKKYADHQDHFSGARFAQEALARYERDKKRPHFTVESYLGYFNGGLPHVLGGKAAEDKLRALDTYAWSDRNRTSCPHEAGCGDLKMVPRQQHQGWSHGIRHTSGDSTGWLSAGSGDSLRAFSVLDGRIAVRERRAGGAGGAGGWGAPELLPGTGIDPGLSPVRLADGGTAVFGTRTLIGPEPAGYSREVGFTVQQGGRTGSFGPWQTLGTPEPADAVGLSDISAPAVSVAPDGALTVVVRNSNHSLSARVQQPGGAWLPWLRLGGRAVHGDPAVGTDAEGRLYVVASTPKNVLAWFQKTPGGDLSGPVTTGLPPTTGPVRLQEDGDGVRLYFRAPRTGSVSTARLRGADLVRGIGAGAGTVPGTGTGASVIAPVKVTDLGGPGGYGPIGVSRLSGGDTLLAARTGRGDLATTVVRGTPGDAGASGAPGAPARPRWSSTGFLFAGTPSTSAVPSGGGVVAVTGLDGRLYWAPVGSGRAGGWRPA